jgi:hypothetical protein
LKVDTVCWNKEELKDELGVIFNRGFKSWNKEELKDADIFIMSQMNSWNKEELKVTHFWVTTLRPGWNKEELKVGVLDNVTKKIRVEIRKNWKNALVKE